MTIIYKTVAVSSDDAYELSGTMNIDSTPSQIIDATTEYFGARWGIGDAPIPAGATITSCSANFYFPSGTLDEPLHGLRFELSGSPATFSLAANNISSRTMTSASELWNNTNLGAPGFFSTPSLVAPLQELVNSGSTLYAIVLIVQGSSTPTRDFQVQTIDSGVSGSAGKIWIEYTDPPPALTVANATQGLTSDSISLTQHNILVVQNTTQILASDSVSLTQHQSLLVNNTTQISTSDNVSLSQNYILSLVNNTTHTLTSDNVTLTAYEPAISLSVQDTTQILFSDNVILTTGASIPVKMIHYTRLRSK